ncbi:MAG TPA: hypothetical protein VK920_10135 [Solirubrobacterales bacterium]|nr:hypothetical protein [Solirubrobacterales bacterium]
MSSRPSAPLVPLGLLAALSTLLLAAPSALAHGEEEEAAPEIPARTLVQQGFALLTQQENEAGAQEKLDLALKSEDQKDVDMAAVREALAALKQGDHELAEEHMKVALGGEEKAAAEEEPAGKRAEQGGGAAHEREEAAVAEEVPEEALEHAPAFEPGRGSEEWIALAVGVALVIAALGVLSARRITA